MPKKTSDEDRSSPFEEARNPGQAANSWTGRKNNRFSFGHLLLHIHPRLLAEQSLKLSHTWGLGGGAFLLLLFQAATGVLLLFVFQPAPEKAYDSVRILMNQVPFGRFVRNLHFWSANLLVVVVLLHMLRVFFTDAFHAPRRFNWIIGLCLMASF